MPIRVALADDNLLVREGILHLLEGADGIEVVAVSDDHPGLIDAIERESPDVVVTDIRMPPSQRMEGLDIANSLRGSHPEIAVIVLSQFAEPSYALALLEEGSAGRGYLLKDRLG